MKIKILVAVNHNKFNQQADGAQSLILGCTGMTSVAQNLAKFLSNEGFDIPVIDPSLAAIMQLYSLIKQSLVQSPGKFNEKNHCYLTTFISIRVATWTTT